MCRCEWGVFTWRAPPKRLLGKPAAHSSSTHSGSKCQECGAAPIVGARYQCSQCWRLDLCDACFRRGAHPEHEFLLFQHAASRGVHAARSLLEVTCCKLQAGGAAACSDAGSCVIEGKRSMRQRRSGLPLASGAQQATQHQQLHAAVALPGCLAVGSAIAWSTGGALQQSCRGKLLPALQPRRRGEPGMLVPARTPTASPGHLDWSGLTVSGVSEPRVSHSLLPRPDAASLARDGGTKLQGTHERRRVRRGHSAS
jgi:hypothetical protein